MKKNVLIGSGFAAVILATAGIALAAGATDSGAMMHDSKMMPSSMMMMHPPRPMILTVSASGNGLLRGVVQSVGSDSITVAAWGGTWTVKVDNNTHVMPSGDLSKIAVGDFVGVIGSVSEDNPTITADRVRDWTEKHDAMMMKDDHMMATSSDSMHH